MLREEFKKIDTSLKKLREFGFLVGGVFCLIGAVMLWREKAMYPYMLGIGGVLVIFGAILPGTLKPIYCVWMGVALVLGWFVSRVLLSILFYIAVTPIALVTRLMGKDFLDLKFGEAKDSYWIPRKREAAREACEKQY